MTMNIKPIVAVLSIAGMTHVVTGCSEEQSKSFSAVMHTLGATDSVTQQHVAEMEAALPVEPEPPAPEPPKPEPVWHCYPFRGTTFCDWIYP